MVLECLVLLEQDLDLEGLVQGVLELVVLGLVDLELVVLALVDLDEVRHNEQVLSP